MQSCMCQTPEPEECGRIGDGTRLCLLAPCAEPNVPADLSEWVDPSLLSMWIERETRRLLGSGISPVQLPGANSSLSVRRLFCVLCLAYATRRFGSEAIANACRSEAVFCFLCDGGAPQAGQVRAFRQLNWHLLAQILARVFTHAVSNRLNLETDQLPAEIEQDLWNHALERLERAQQTDLNEVHPQPTCSGDISVTRV
jgi:hypothetical protein